MLSVFFYVWDLINSKM